MGEVCLLVSRSSEAQLFYTLSEHLIEAPTSLRMEGSIALGLIIVAGTVSGLGFSDAETGLVVQEVMEGCQSLASAYPRAKVTFVYVTRILTMQSGKPLVRPVRLEEL